MTGQVSVIPVDHRNLRAFYTRGLVTPARLTRRYKPDALAIGGDALLVVPAPLGVPWVRGHEADDGFTVLMELGDPEAGTIALDPASGVRLLAAPMSVSSVTAVHTRSEAGAAEIRSREYRNLDPAVIPLRVSPDLFEGSGPDEATLQDWVHSQTPPYVLDEAALVEHECVAGAVALLLDGVAPRQGLLEGATGLAAGLLADDGEVSPLRRLGAMVRELGWLPDEQDALGFEVVARAIAGQSGPEEPAPMDLLDAVAHGFGAAAEEQDFERLVDYIGAVIRGEREFAGFRSSSGHAAMKSLLLFLLRPSAGETRSWFSEQMELSDEVRALALLWSGLSCRFAGVPSGQRGSPELQASLQGWMCGIPESGIAVVSDGSDLRLEASRGQLAQWAVETPSLRSRLLAACEPHDPDAVRVALELGWDECLETIIEADQAELTAARGKAVMRMRGRPRITHNVLPGPFIERLSSLSEAEMEAIQGAAPAPARARRPRKRTSK